MKISILVALKDSVVSRTVVDYLSALPFCPDDLLITLLHVFRKPSSSEELMGETFIKEELSRLSATLEQAKDKLVENGFNPDNIKIDNVSDPYPTVADGIIDQARKQEPQMVVIGRKRKSKAEEFVMGDISIKLVRNLEKSAVLVVKSP